MMSSRDRHLGEFVTWHFAATDRRSPITEVRVFFTNPNGATRQTVRQSGVLTHGRISFGIDPRAPVGHWKVTGVRLVDSSGNARNFGPSGEGVQSVQPSVDLDRRSAT